MVDRYAELYAAFRWSVPQRLGLALALVAGGLIAHG